MYVDQAHDTHTALGLVDMPHLYTAFDRCQGTSVGRDTVPCDAERKKEKKKHFQGGEKSVRPPPLSPWCDSIGTARRESREALNRQKKDPKMIRKRTIPGSDFFGEEPGAGV
jgi:hypothetical protein